MRNGRRLSPPRDVPPAARKRVPTSAAGGSQTRWRQSDETAAARRDGGRVKRSRRLCYLAKSPTLLTPSEASSLAVQSQPSAKNATDNHLLVTHLLNPEEAGSPAVESHPVGCKLSVALNQLRPSI